MPLTKLNKKKILDDLEKKLSNAKTLVFASFGKLKVNDMQDLRKKLREKKICLKVVKNSLLKKALDEKKIEVEKEILDQPLACVFGEDEVEPARIVFDFGKTNENLKILGGILEQKYAGSAQIEALAKLPSKQELYGQVVLRIKSPLAGFVNVLRGNLTGLVSVLKQYHDNIK